MGLGGENKHFLFHTPYVKNASFSRYSIVLLPYIPVQELSRLAKRVFARNRLVFSIDDLKVDDLDNYWELRRDFLHVFLSYFSI